MIKSIVGIIAGALSAFVTAAAIADSTAPSGAKLAPLPELKVGDWWLGKGQPKVVVTAVAAGKITMRRGDGKEFVYTLEINKIEGPSPSGETLTWKPFDPFLSFPIWTGKEWGGEVQTFVGSMARSSYTRSAKAGEWEKVAIDGQELEAIRIDYNSTIDPRILMCWYAPKAKAIVKCQAPNASTPGYLMVEFGVSTQ